MQGKKRRHRTSRGGRAGKSRRNRRPADMSRRLIICKVVIIALISAVALAGVCIPLYGYFSANGGLVNKKPENSGYYTQEEQTQLLTVVNRANTLAPDYVPSLVTVEGVRVNSLAEKNLTSLLTKAREDGADLRIKEGYISYEEQKALYEEKYNSLLEQNGITAIKAQAQTVRLVPKAGESEAQTGLSVLFYDGENDDFSRSKSAVWLNENAVDYGFILRYPKGKEDFTSMEYNPALYRFTGEENAMQTRILGMCLEEYRDYLAQK